MLGSPRGGGIGLKVAKNCHFTAGGSIGCEPNRWSGRGRARIMLRPLGRPRSDIRARRTRRRRSVSGNPRAGSAPRRGLETGRQAAPFGGVPLGAARRFADSVPPAPLRRVCAALSGSDRRRGYDRSHSAPSGRAGGVRGGGRRRLTDSRRAGANRSASAWDGRARGRDRRRAIDSRRGGAGRAFRPCVVGNVSPVAAGALTPPFLPGR